MNGQVMNDPYFVLNNDRVIKLKNGRILFSVAKHTVLDTDKDFAKDTEAIENGVFYESKHRSAPYFDVKIDGIKLLNEKF